MRAPTDIGRATRTVSERVEVAAYGGAVQRALLGLEILGVDERLGARRTNLGVRELGVFEEAIRHSESSVGRPVGEPLPACVLACETAAAHLVGAAQHRRRNPWELGLAI